MDRKLRQCGVAALLFVTSLAAANAAEDGFYVGATGSRVEQDVKGEDGIVVAFVGNFPIPSFGRALEPGRVEVDDVQAGWSATLGYVINKHIAAEVTYHDFGEAAVTERYFPALPPLPAEIVIRSNIAASGPSLSVLGTWPLNSSLDVFARGGLLFVDEDIERRQGSFRSEQSIGDEVLMVGLGAQWTFAPRWAVRLEYQRTGSIDYGADDINTAGTEKIEQFSLSVLFNL